MCDVCVGPINFSGVGSGGGGGATLVQSLRAQSSVSVSHDEAVAVITSLLPPLSPLTSHHGSKLSGGSCCSPPSPPGPGRPRPRSVYDLNYYNINIVDHIIM